MLKVWQILYGSVIVFAGGSGLTGYLFFENGTVACVIAGIVSVIVGELIARTKPSYKAEEVETWGAEWFARALAAACLGATIRVIWFQITTLLFFAYFFYKMVRHLSERTSPSKV